MTFACFPLALPLTLATAVSAAPARPVGDAERPLVGDVVHGALLLEKAGAPPRRVNGAWINAYTDAQALAHLTRGTDGFPRVAPQGARDDGLDRWDALAALRASNTDLRDLAMGADHVLITTAKLDEHAQKRLVDQAKLAPATAFGERRVFALYELGAGSKRDSLTFVGERDTKKRDLLKKNTKVGYVVFVDLPGVRGGGHEAAFAIDKDIRIQQIVVRAPDGSVPVDLNQAAARFLGKGARGRYDALKAGGAGKAVAELQQPLSDAFLLAAEAVYMFEVGERDYFEFGG
jgi:hypothetical protein